MEINCHIDILISSQHSGILLSLRLQITGRTIDNIRNLLSAETGIGSSQIEMEPVLMNERETAVKIQQVLVLCTGTNNRKQA